jgi:hypothetical protein
MTPTTLISLLEKIYRLLLFLYPPEYRRQYGDSMMQVFRDVCRDRYYQRGISGIVLWWFATVLDLALTAIEERFMMFKTIWARLAKFILSLDGKCATLTGNNQLQQINTGFQAPAISPRIIG